MAKHFYHPSVDDLTIDSVLYALSDPYRRNMVFRMMGCEGMNCTEACGDQLSASTISFHTRILREAGLIRSEKKGVSVINTVRKEDIDKRFPGLLHAVFQHHKKDKKVKRSIKK
jgi:DNA-binding transcriptional ArsR family regulator